MDCKLSYLHHYMVVFVYLKPFDCHWLLGD